MYILDLHDAGFWLIRLGDKTWPAGTDKQAAIHLIARLNQAHYPNIERRDNQLYVCWNEHEKGAACSFERVIDSVFPP